MVDTPPVSLVTFCRQVASPSELAGVSLPPPPPLWMLTFASWLYRTVVPPLLRPRQPSLHEDQREMGFCYRDAGRSCGGRRTQSPRNMAIRSEERRVGKE